MLDKIIKQLEKEVLHLFKNDSTGHDIHHLKRTLRLALAIQAKEGGDRLVIGVAAFLHDIHRTMQRQAGKFCTPKESLPEVKKILDKTTISAEHKKKILHVIEHHEEYGFTKEGKTVHDPETLIVQDADNLDAIGAIGIGRAFSYGGAYSIPMWVPNLVYKKKYHDEAVNDPSAIHHFQHKALKLKNNMHTKTAKKMAITRHKFIELFIKQFLAEWEQPL